MCKTKKCLVAHILTFQRTQELGVKALTYEPFLRQTASAECAILRDVFPHIGPEFRLRFWAGESVNSGQ